MATPGAQAANSPLIAVFWMFVTGWMFVGVTATVKYVGTDLPAQQAAFLRYILGLVFLIPMIRPMLEARLNRRQVWLFGWRGLAHAIGVMLWFYAMSRITMAEVVALNFMNPIYVTLGAAVFLGERLAFRRLAAVLIAFAGAMVILRPGFRELDSAHMGLLLGAVALGVSYLLAKRMSGDFSAAVVVGMLSVIVSVVLLPFAVAVWVPPTWEQIGWMFVVASFATGGHYTMTLAFAAAPVAVTQPVAFLQLLWAVLVGAAFFGEPADIWVVTGGSLILGSVSFIAWREHVLRRRRAAPVPPV